MLTLVLLHLQVCKKRSPCLSAIITGASRNHQKQSVAMQTPELSEASMACMCASNTNCVDASSSVHWNTPKALYSPMQTTVNTVQPAGWCQNTEEKTSSNNNVLLHDWLLDDYCDISLHAGATQYL